MKKAILIILLFGTSQAQVNKKKLRSNLHDCESALSACLSAKDTIGDTIYIYTAKEAVKVAKQAEKTKRKLSKHDNKTERKEQSEKTKRNFVFQFFTSIKRIITSLTLGQQFAGGGGIAALYTAFVEKYKPFSKLFSVFKNK
jgi:hypothetical protein